jgi:cytochrome c oxidase assembly factor 5
MTSACADLRMDLVDCIKKSDCVSVQQRSAKDCLKHGGWDGSVKPDCIALYRAFVDCKKGMWDLRKRFRGNSRGKVDKKKEWEPGMEEEEFGQVHFDELGGKN